MAVAISGAIILKEDKNRLTYIQKCEYCGATGNTYHEGALRSNATRTGVYYCTKCGKKSNIILRGN